MMLVLVNDALVWLGAVGSLVALAAYLTQRWYGNAPGRIMVLVLLAAFFLYAKSVVALIDGTKLSETAFSLAINAVVAAIMVYAAVSFVSLIRVRYLKRRIEKQRAQLVVQDQANGDG